MKTDCDSVIDQLNGLYEMKGIMIASAEAGDVGGIEGSGKRFGYLLAGLDLMLVVGLISDLSKECTQLRDENRELRTMLASRAGGAK